MDDMQAEYEAVKRKRAIADAMLQRGLSPQQPIQHWAQGLAQLYNAHQGRKGVEKADMAAKELATRQAQGQQAAIEQLQRGVQGTPAQVMPEGQMGPAAPAMPAPIDKVRQALLAAQTSQYPLVRQLGQTQQRFVEADNAREDSQQARADQQKFQADQAATVRKEQYQAKLDQIREAAKQQRISKAEAVRLANDLKKEASGRSGEYGSWLPTADGYVFGVQKGPRSGQLVKPGGDPVVRSQDNPSLQGAITAAKTGAEATAKRDFNMQGIGNVIGEAEKILGGKVAPTGSGVGAVVDKAGSMVGVSPKGAAEADQLKVLSGVLTSKVPRFEGPQSDADRKFYVEMAGQVGDSTLPISRRVAALETVKRLWKASEGQKTATPVAGGEENWVRGPDGKLMRAK